MKIKIKIEPTFSVKWPMLRVKINDMVVHDGICEPTESKFFILQKDIMPNTRNSIEIQHYDKKGRETVTDQNGEVVSDRALILKSISLDGYEIPELTLHDKEFEVHWTKEQIKEDHNRPSTIKNNLYFGYNGIYRLEFGNDGAKEYFHNLIEKERIANIHNKKEMIGPDGRRIEVFEFTGRLVDSNEEEAITIAQLYERIQGED